MPQIHFLYVAPILLVITGLTAVVVSLAGPPPPAEKTAELTWSPRFFAAESVELRAMPWYKNYRVLSVLVLLFTAITVVSFW
jgi:SSS family solute:Na+ symporter